MEVIVMCELVYLDYNVMMLVVFEVVEIVLCCMMDVFGNLFLFYVLGCCVVVIVVEVCVLVVCLIGV